MASLPPHTGVSFVQTSHHDTYPFITSKNSKLKGKHVLITGASKGCGRATALSFARAGASGIAVGARSSLSALETEILSIAKEMGHPPPTVVVLKMDVEDKANLTSVAREVEEKFNGRLDILINNAGYLGDFTPIVESDPDDWWKTWSVNVNGVYLVTRAFLPLMLKGGDKQIVNLSSVGAHNRTKGASAYQTTKFAIGRFTEFICSDYGEQGVLAYAVHPGGVPTELALRMPKDRHFGKCRFNVRSRGGLMAQTNQHSPR